MKSSRLDMDIVEYRLLFPRYLISKIKDLMHQAASGVST